jgi:hypothetical protein
VALAPALSLVTRLRRAINEYHYDGTEPAAIIMSPRTAYDLYQETSPFSTLFMSAEIGRPEERTYTFMGVQILLDAGIGDGDYLIALEKTW